MVLKLKKSLFSFTLMTMMTALVAEPANPRNFCRHSTGTSSETNPPVGAQPRLKQYEREPNLKLPFLSVKVSVKDVEKSWNRKCVALLIREGSVDQPWFWTLEWRLPPRQWSLKPSWIEKSWKYLSKLLDNWKINGPPWGNPYMAAKKENASMQDSNPKIWNWSMPVATVGASCFKF